MSDTIKRGTLSKNRKNCLDLVNIEAKRQPRGLSRFSDSPEAYAARPRPILRFARGPRRKALADSPIRPRPTPQGLGRGTDSPPRPRPLARGPARKASDEVPILRLARGRLGISPAAALTDLPDGASHPTETLNHSHNVSRTMAQYSGVVDGTGDRTGQGLSATVLGTVPITNARTALCYLIPALGTTRRGESSPGHYSLGISV